MLNEIVENNTVEEVENSEIAENDTSVSEAPSDIEKEIIDYLNPSLFSDIKTVTLDDIESQKDEQDDIRGFLVEKDFKGFSTPVMEGKWSLRASITSELVLEDVFVPDSHVFPDIAGLKGPLGCLTQARYGIGWGAIGAAMDVYETALQYSKDRIQFDKPIASFQLVQEKLVWMLSEITKGQMMNLQVGRLKDSGDMKHQQVSMSKGNNVWVARECCKLARDIHGANGISGEYPIMRHLMNIESVFTYEGTHDMHTLILGNDITGISSFE